MYSIVQCLILINVSMYTLAVVTFCTVCTFNPLLHAALGTQYWGLHVQVFNHYPTPPHPTLILHMYNPSYFTQK